ncbi:protein-lysine N-methyltransferase EEF2KMT isoform X1 [Lates japonicus]|uniref:Protein-lysine N-methyltransferase EEF2KMT isoform X1 n=1 Tax=Lates japonicus TaxID=270547 RepID=A0AAD3M7Q1_LATJO|nr:protein-lysine N-methyltransferase EEF2KMT isoform X1 [Lates japonicus]
MSISKLENRKKFPPSVRYRAVLTGLIRRQEAAGCDPLDELYDALAEVVGAERTATGDPGLWWRGAALYLAEWAPGSQQAFTAVLELEQRREKLPRANVQLSGLTEQETPTVSVEAGLGQRDGGATETDKADTVAMQILKRSSSPGLHLSPLGNPGPTGGFKQQLGEASERLVLWVFEPRQWRD